MTKAATAQTGNRVVQYVQDTRAELRKVVWPTREEAINLTGVVLLVTLVMTIILGGMDLAFGQIVNAILGFGS